jgi:hypothetical protein
MGIQIIMVSAFFALIALFSFFFLYQQRKLKTAMIAPDNQLEEKIIKIHPKIDLSTLGFDQQRSATLQPLLIRKIIKTSAPKAKNDSTFPKKNTSNLNLIVQPKDSLSFLGHQLYELVKHENLILKDGKLVGYKHADQHDEYCFSITALNGETFEKHNIYQITYQGFEISTHKIYDDDKDYAATRTLQAIQFMMKNWKMELLDTQKNPIKPHVFKKWHHWMQKNQEKSTV